MRLIDADALKKSVPNTHVDIFENCRNCELLDDEQVEELIDNAPTIDAVPVVRCKDCRWWDNSEDSPFGYCMAMKHGYMSENWEIGIYRRYKGDFYCADAERKEDE